MSRLLSDRIGLLKWAVCIDFFIHIFSLIIQGPAILLIGSSLRSNILTSISDRKMVQSCFYFGRICIP